MSLFKVRVIQINATVLADLTCTVFL